MIDFRYHLVSIVSIFMALAVGIVLGAGPLQGQIGDTLTSEITQLRTDKQALRGEVSDLNKALATATSYDTATLRRVVTGTLTGRAVAIVELPGADADEVRAIGETVVAAGGTVASTTRVLDAWVSTDPKVVTSRTDVADKLAVSLRVTPSAAGASPSTLDKVLAAALVPTSASIPGTEVTRAALTDLVGAKLIEGAPQDTNPAQFVVVVTAPLAGVAAETTAAADAWMQMIAALEAASAATVATISAGAALGDQETSVVRVLRKNPGVAKAVSTVDDAGSPAGLASIVLGLVALETGAVGHYGTDEGASAAFAPVPVP